MNDNRQEMVNHPNHYAWLKTLCGVEPIDICQHFNFNIGNALKYLMRKGKTENGMTDTEQRIQDLLKAQFYIDYEIINLRRQIAEAEADDISSSVKVGEHWSSVEDVILPEENIGLCGKASL